VAARFLGHNRPSTRNATVIIVLVLSLFLLLGERDRMPTQKQASGQRS